MPGGGAIYVGTKYGRLLAEDLNARGCHAHVQLIDFAISNLGLALVTKEEAATIERQSAILNSWNRCLETCSE